MHVGSSSLTRDQTQAPCIGKHGVLSTAPPGTSLSVDFLAHHTYLLKVYQRKERMNDISNQHTGNLFSYYYIFFLEKRMNTIF